MRSPFPGVLRRKKIQFYMTVFAKNVLNKLKFTTKMKIGHTLGSPVPIYLTSFFWIGWNYKLFWFLLLVQRPENGTDIHFWLLESWTGHAQILIDPTAISNFKAYSLHCLMPMTILMWELKFQIGFFVKKRLGWIALDSSKAKEILTLQVHYTSMS